MNKKQNIAKYAQEAKGAFVGNDQNVLDKVLTYLDFISLSRVSTVSSFFRRKVLEQRGYWIGYLHRYLPAKGFSAESINLFFSMVSNAKVDYPKMLERFNLLKRIDFTMANLSSSEVSMNTLHLNSVDYGHRYLALLSGQMPLLCQISHQCIRIHKDQSKAEALFSIAYLLGMTNMSEEFVQWVKVMEISGSRIYLPFLQGLTYKQHDTELVRFLTENAINLQPFRHQLTAHLNIGCAMRSESPPAEVLPFTREQAQLSVNKLAIYCSYSSNVDNFTQLERVTNLYFILGLFASENVRLFTHLITSNILSPNQLYDYDYEVGESEVGQGNVRFAGGRANIKYELAFGLSKANFPSNVKISLFQLACHFGSLAVVRLLVEQGCDTEYGNDNLHSTPLKLALLSKQLSIANFLCENEILPTEEKSLFCSLNLNPLHFLLKFNILEVRKYYPFLYAYITKLLKATVTQEIADRFMLDNAVVGTPLCLLPGCDSEALTPVDCAHIYHQVHTLCWLLKNNYITDITPSRLFTDILDIYFSTFYYSERGSLQDLEPYLPSVENHDEVQAMLDAIWRGMSGFMIRLNKSVYPEEYYFIYNSFLFLLKHYSNAINAESVFNQFITELLEFDHMHIELVIDRYEDFLRPLIEFFPNGVTYRPSGILIRNRADLLILVFENADNHQELNFIQYYLELFYSKYNFFGDIDPLVTVTDIQDLILKAPAEYFSQVNPNDDLLRDIICKVIDCYLKNPSQENLNVLHSIISKVPSLQTSDSESQSALMRIFENEDAHPEMYELFYRIYGSNPNKLYYSDFLDHKSYSGDNKRIRQHE